MLGIGCKLRCLRVARRTGVFLAVGMACLIANPEHCVAIGPENLGPAVQSAEFYATPIGGSLSLSNARNIAAGRLSPDNSASEIVPERGASPALGRTVAPEDAADAIPEASQARAMATAAAEAAVEAGIANDPATAALAAARAENAAEAAARAAEDRARLLGTSEGQAAARAAAEAAARARLNAQTAAEAAARLRQARRPAHPDSLWLD